MTELNLICETCKQPAIGVACTSIPYSAAYCAECARRGSDPEWIFEFWAEEIGGPDELSSPDYFNTFKDGKYITYREWWNLSK